MPSTEVEPEVILIPVGQIVADRERVQPRVQLDQDAIEDYKLHRHELPPVEVWHVLDEGKFYTTDGFHRHYIHVDAGADEIPCVVVGEGTIEQAVLKATGNGHNRKNGVRLSRADKRRAVRLTLLCKETATWPDAQVAEHCGVSRGLVDEVRSEMATEGLVDPTVPQVRKDGRTQKPSRQNANQHFEPGRSIVDGVEQDDPPDVAEARRNGFIPADAVPVVSKGTSEHPAFEPEPEAEEDEMHWVDNLPLASVLQGAQLTSFRREAAFYRRFNEARKGATLAFVGIKAGIGREYPGVSVTPYEDRVSRSLKVNGPAEWTVCPDNDSGGCGGTGTDVLDTRCMKCKGAGYLVA